MCPAHEIADKATDAGWAKERLAFRLYPGKLQFANQRALAGWHIANRGALCDQIHLVVRCNSDRDRPLHS